MDIFDIGEIKTKLNLFLKRFKSCAADKRARNYFRLYVSGLISNLPRKIAKPSRCNASMDVPLDDLLLTAFSRWRVERSFQDTKQKIGLDHYEGRNYQGLIRHLLLCSLAYYCSSDVSKTLAFRRLL